MWTSLIHVLYYSLYNLYGSVIIILVLYFIHWFVSIIWYAIYYIFSILYSISFNLEQAMILIKYVLFTDFD